MSLEPVKIALIGLGKMGLNHLNTLLTLRKRGLVSEIALYDIRREAVEELSKRARAKPLENLDQLGEYQPDGVIIATPTSTHLEVTREAVKHTKYILLEKPPAATLEETMEIIRLAEEHGATILVGVIERFNPAVTHMLRYTKIHGDARVSIYGCRTTQLGDRRKDIGALLDLAIHDLYIISELLNLEEMDKKIWKVSFTEPYDLEDAGAIRLSGENTSINLYVSRLHARKIRRLLIGIDDTYILTDMISKTVSVKGPHGRQEYQLMGDSLRNEHNHFIGVIKGLTQPATPIDRVYEVMKILF